MTVPNQFANVTTSIPLSQLDANFNTPITLGNTAIQLGNTVTTLNNMTLANVTISSGNVTITNVSVTTANVTTANIATANIATEIVTTSQTLNYGTANAVVYLNGSKVSTTGTALQFNGTNFGVGVTPSNWTLGRAIEVGTSPGNGIWGVGASNMNIVSNVYYDGAYKFAGTGFAGTLSMSGGGFGFASSTASGTAGGSISFVDILGTSKGNTLYLEGASAQAGTGITFPATQSASSNANTLDDYEEGTWTPTFTASGRTFTYGDRVGYYTKIGRQVFAQFYLRALVDSATATNVSITGLPFTSANLSLNQGPLCVSYVDFVSPDYSWLVGYPDANTTTANLLWTNSDVNTSVQADNFPTTGVGAYLVGTFIYFSS